MCGINGFNWKDEPLMQKMNQATKNRGPDDIGIYIDDNVSLGHNRLSIIDLSPKGHQPMSNEDGTIWITYNGEIYNFQELKEQLVNHGHRFKSNTDTEIIIHAYEEFGLDFVKKFNGMWAFCIYDKNRGILVLSRDQFGIKPLYYYISDNQIIFSSMISGILCHNIKISPNDKAIMEYLAYNLEDHQTYTFFENIFSLSHTDLLVYNLKEKTSELINWYTFKPKHANEPRSLKGLFMESVKLRTIADVPVGSCLSGGVDSSSIVCTLDNYLNNTFYTFSLIAPGTKYDESKYIKEIGKHTKTEQFFVQIDKDIFLNDIYDFITAQEEPVTLLSPYAQYIVMRLAHDHGAKVLLDGQGGDELFAGYPYYFSYYFYELLINFKLFTLLKEMVLYYKNFRDLYPYKMLLFILMPEFIKPRIFSSMINIWINDDYLKKICNSSDPRWNKMDLSTALLLTLNHTAIPHLLRWEDKNSMRWSIETRPPFLDINLVEHSMGIQSDQKLKDGKTKYIYRKEMKDIIPSMITGRKDKMGFETTVNDLFRDPKIIAFFQEIINSETFKNRPYWDHAQVKQLFNKHVEGKIHIGDTIWKWINLELWLRIYFNHS